MHPELEAGTEMPLRLRDHLCVPYLLEAETVEAAPGAWIRRVSYPELPDCRAESLVVEDALRRLEGLRIQTIIAMLKDGVRPPVPRPPLKHCDPAWVAEQAGLSNDVIALIERDENEIIDVSSQDR